MSAILSKLSMCICAGTIGAVSVPAVHHVQHKMQAQVTRRPKLGVAAPANILCAPGGGSVSAMAGPGALHGDAGTGDTGRASCGRCG